MAVLENLGIGSPVVQAGMGGGIGRHELAAAVSEAGGLGTIAVNGAVAIERELAAARVLTDRPIAVNLLLPFARRDWFEAASGADAVVTFWGAPRRRTAGVWIHQCGSLAEAHAANSAGVDAAILQGVEAGGHVRGELPALELLERVRSALPDLPVLLAGGIAERADVARALEAGAEGAVAGTRFLLSSESRAHPDYRSRLLAAEETLLTDLFGAGWPAAKHRVVANAATERRLGPDGRTPLPNRILNRLSGVGNRYTPASLQARIVRDQRPGSRLLSPQGPIDDGPPTLVDAGPLYAGETVARIDDIRPAADLVAALTP